MEDWTNLIELVDSTSDRKMCYLVALLDDEYFNGKPARRGEGRAYDMACFFTAEETIQFLSDKELFGWIVRKWSFFTKWNSTEEMSIELYRKEL